MTHVDRSRAVRLVIWAAVVAMLSLGLAACAAPPIPEMPEIKPVEATNDPLVWAEAYPVQYRHWLATGDVRPEGESKYKRGFDGGLAYDKLSEWPFMPLLFKGWGFGIDYNEPRGHVFMVRDQSEADPSRVGAGGACLTCKSPSADRLYREQGEAFMSMPYTESLDLLPEGERELGVSCIDCHDNETLEVRSERWTVKQALSDIGLADPNAQQQRIIACGQCHVTYSVMKDEGKSVDVNFPWQGGSWGNISIETIIENLETDPARIEWTQEVTGFKLGFIRHPDMEFFTDGSVHYKAGLGCPDCHMPYVVDQGTKTADHNIMSPLKRDMDACLKCHPESPAEMKAQVLAIQNRAASMLMNTGYAVAGNAKLFELLNASIDPASPEYAADYQQAAAYYRQAFYRVVYMGAENSIGFHNPSEGGRILRDAMQYSGRADALLRQIAARADIAVPVEIDLELGKYLTNRGVKPLGYVAWQTFEDPFPTSKNLWGANIDSLKSVETAEPHTMSLWETPTE